MRGSVAALAAAAVVACVRPSSRSAVDVNPAGSAAAVGGGLCGAGKRMTVHFYDVGQGLAALVDLPDGRHVLVDAGDNPRRRGCEMCGVHSEHLLRRLSIDLGDSPIDVVWVTHQHSDHLGGAREVLAAFKVGMYVDNGRDADRPEVRGVHRAAGEHGVAVRVVDPEHRAVPITGSADATFRAVLPPVWPLACEQDPDECSIGLRIDFCASSVLFMGDAEHDEEAVVDPGGPASLLQVAHHGSETSTTPGFLVQARPKYAVISAARPGEGPNREYCHPRAPVVERLTRALGGEASSPLEAFGGQRCERATASDWVSVPASDRLWATERDGDVVLMTNGDGTFVKQ